MRNYNLNDLADDLNSLHARSLNIVQGATSGSANPGQSISFRYADATGRQHTVTGMAYSVCSPGNVTGFRLENGAWVVMGSSPTTRTDTALHESRRRRPKVDRGKVKILFTTERGTAEEGTIELRIGGWKPGTDWLATYPHNSQVWTEIDNVTLNNLGGDRWIATWRYRTRSRSSNQIVAEDVIVRETSQTWKASDFGLAAADLGGSVGFGVVSYSRTLSDIPVPGGVFASSSHGVRGYWFKEAIVTRPWSGVTEDIFNNGVLFGSKTIYSGMSPIRLNQFAIETIEATTTGFAGSDPGGDYTIINREGTWGLINDQRNQTIVTRFRYSIEEFKPESMQIEYRSFFYDDQGETEITFTPFGESDFLGERVWGLPGDRHNWIANRFYFVEIPNVSPAAKTFTSSALVTVKNYAINGGRIEHPTDLKAKTFPLGIDPEKTAILAASFHPN